MLSKLCCFKITKREARVLMFCVWKGVCVAHCVNTVGPQWSSGPQHNSKTPYDLFIVVRG